ncbi:MAG: hypothetical protein K0R63_1022 [Rickettsiales bacterium]|jgi:hypothetical protein|nr:hypothetical protein [Rickettsiales bacterium]
MKEKVKEAAVSSPFYLSAAMVASVVSFWAQKLKAKFQTSPKDVLATLSTGGMRALYHGFPEFRNRQLIIAIAGGPCENLAPEGQLVAGAALQALGETTFTVRAETLELRPLTNCEKLVPESGPVFRESMRHIFLASLVRNWAMWTAAGYSAEKEYGWKGSFSLGATAGVASLLFDNALTRQFGKGKDALYLEAKSFVAWAKDTASLAPEVRNVELRNVAKNFGAAAFFRAMTIGLFTPFMVMAQRKSSEVYKEHFLPHTEADESLSSVKPAAIMTANAPEPENSKWQDYVRQGGKVRNSGPEL